MGKQYIPDTGTITKTAIAKKLGVSRQSLYYRKKRPLLDEEMKTHIESVMLSHPSYGHKRIALELAMGKNRIWRIMKKFSLKPLVGTYKRYPVKPNDLKKNNAGVLNVVKILCPIQPSVVWVSDFTYMKYHESFIYLATIMDSYTREVVGYNISRYHTKELVLGALIHALGQRPPPRYLHSDQGSEYDNYRYYDFLRKQSIIVSMSSKSSPWQNGKQESFYGHFKKELGSLNEFRTLPELIEAIHLQIHYYNTQRIHSVLKTIPRHFYDKSMSKKAGT